MMPNKSQPTAKSAAKTLEMLPYAEYEPAKHPIAKNDGVSPLAPEAWKLRQPDIQRSFELKVENAWVISNKGKASDRALRLAYELKDCNDKDDLADAKRIDVLLKAYANGTAQAGVLSGWLGNPSKAQLGEQAVDKAAAAFKGQVSAEELGQLTAVAKGKTAAVLTCKPVPAK